MRPIAADGRQIRADGMDIGTTDTRDQAEMDIGTTDTRDQTEMDIGTADTRDRTETDIGTMDTRGRVKMATEVVGMKEEIEIGNDEIGRADGLSAGEMRESSATSRGGGTTEGTDAMSHEGDMTRGTAGMIREGGVPPDKFYILGSGAVETILNDGAILDAVIDNGSEAVIIDEDLAVQVGLGLDRSYLFEIETADGRKQQITGVCHKAAIEVQGVRVTLPVFAVKNCSSDLLLGRTWLSHVHAVTIERPNESQTLSIRKPDGTRVMIETVEPRDQRNRAALAVGARPSDQIKSLPISGRAVRFREKRYGPLLTEEEGRIVEVEDLGSRLIVDGNSYPKEKDEEFGGVVSVFFLRARPPMGGYPSDTSE
ncbi:hypothetical protein CBR_g30232 [Chara braunii]|uniref:Uncharacterized protein n=1 Tax=Chara braunii TaxID=69332 RepID=A0A388LCD8_CHABU|nr:hypothetical protein CBR_g30232 [Chara braunii]|eukprot:GBG79970.1 hypothetical protein CBR_g30232 [Chara braunii]